MNHSESTDENLPPEESTEDKPHRELRSFVRRGGRITAAQTRALQELWPMYGIDLQGDLLDLDTVFGRAAPYTLEIGFGNGDNLLALAAQRPECNFLGIEVHEPGVGRVLLAAQEGHLRNLRVMRDDAVEMLKKRIADESFDEILIFFPDPWHKKRHHKRRLIQSSFAQLLTRKLKTGGRLRLATDWQHYAEQMLSVLNGCAELQNCSTNGTYVARPQSRPVTRFERRGHRLGHAVWDLEYKKCPIAATL